jgi:hypothetical protein
MLIKIKSYEELVRKVELKSQEIVNIDESPNYGEILYWNDRYANEEDNIFDWLG